MNGFLVNTPSFVTFSLCDRSFLLVDGRFELSKSSVLCVSLRPVFRLLQPISPLLYNLESVQYSTSTYICMRYTKPAPSN